MLTHPITTSALLMAAVLAIATTPTAVFAHSILPSRRHRDGYQFWSQATSVATASAPTTYVTIRHTPVMAATLAALLDHIDRSEEGWMLITDVERALSDRHPGSGVRAALDRLSGITVVIDDDSFDVLEIADHPSEKWTNRRTGKEFKRQIVRLTPAGYRWATDYVRNMHKGTRDRVALRQRTTGVRRSVLRTTPILP